MAELREGERYGVCCGREEPGATVLHVKLTETALRALESYQGCKVRGGGRARSPGSAGLRRRGGRAGGCGCGVSRFRCVRPRRGPPPSLRRDPRRRLCRCRGHPRGGWVCPPPQPCSPGSPGGGRVRSARWKLEAAAPPPRCDTWQSFRPRLGVPAG